MYIGIFFEVAQAKQFLSACQPNRMNNYLLPFYYMNKGGRDQDYILHFSHMHAELSLNFFTKSRVKLNISQIAI